MNRQIVGSHAIASAVVKLLREVVAAARFPSFEALITHLQEVGLKLEQAAPHGDDLYLALGPQAQWKGRLCHWQHRSTGS